MQNNNAKDVKHLKSLTTLFKKYKLPQYQKNRFTMSIYLEIIKNNIDTMKINYCITLWTLWSNGLKRTANNQIPHNIDSNPSLAKKIFFIHITKIIA